MKVSLLAKLDGNRDTLSIGGWLFLGQISLVCSCYSYQLYQKPWSGKKQSGKSADLLPFALVLDVASLDRDGLFGDLGLANLLLFVWA